MAKNVHHKRKRIAHYKNLSEENGDMTPECLDYVSSIIKGMDFGGISLMQSSKFNANSLQSKSKLTQHKNENTASKSQNPYQHTNVPKSKKFGLTRKFPLMEKSQRALKQIRHNRKIPKPRAHLAGIPDSPAKAHLKVSQVIAKKGKEVTKMKKDLKPRNKKKSDKPVPNVTCLSLEQRQPILKNKDEETSKSVKSHDLTRNSVKGSSSIDCTDKTIVNSSDSEYEKFIQNQKKDLPQKSKQQKKHKVSKNIRKAKLKKQYDSDVSDNVDAIPSHTYRRSKRINNTVEDNETSNAPVSNEASESEMDMDDGETYRGSSSEDDETPTQKNVTINSTCNVQYPEQERMELNSTSVVNSYIKYESNTSHDSEYDKNINSRDSASNHLGDIISSSVDDHPENIVLKKEKGEAAEDIVIIDDIEIAPNEASDTFEGKLPSVPSFSNVKIETMVSINKTQPINHPESFDVAVKSNSIIQTIKLEQKTQETFKVHSNAKSTTLLQLNQSKEWDNSCIDLTASDNECENNMPVAASTAALQIQMNATNQALQSDSDESDIEMVDVVVYKAQAGTKCHAECNRPCCSNQSSIKVEKVNSTSVLTNDELGNVAKLKVESKTPEKEIHENKPAYVTDIGNAPDGSIDSKDMISKKLHLNENIVLNNMTKQFEGNTVLDRKMKKELDGDEDIIILDDNEVATSSTCASLKKLKSYDVLNSNLRLPIENSGALMSLSNNKIDDSGDIKSLIETLKSALKSYESIVQLETNIGNHFKTLEQQQAQRLLELRAMIQKRLGNDVPIISNAKEVRDSKCDVPELSSSRTIMDGMRISLSHSSKVASQIQGPSSEHPNAFSAIVQSAILEQDIKPVVEHLLEPSQKLRNASREENTMSFGEKCCVCGKDAVAACQQCAKVFFCSNVCGEKYWDDGHRYVCGN